MTTGPDASSGADATRRMERATLVRRTLDLCRRRWTVSVLFALAERPQRFNELPAADGRSVGEGAD